MKYLAIVLASLFVAAPVKSGEPLPPGGLDCGHCPALEFDRLVTLLGDEVLREMVCRVSYERYTPESLGYALGIPKAQVMRRIDTLRGWGLTRLTATDWGTTVVEPLPGQGAGTLRRWAFRYCPQDGVCAVASANEDASKDTNTDRAISDGGTHGHGGTSDKGKATIESLSAVTLFTHDMRRAVRFYLALGFEVVNGGAEAGFTSFRTGQSYLNLTKVQPHRRWSSWGRVVIHVTDVDAFYRRAVAQGLGPPHRPSDAPWGERYFHLTDPDKHEISFAQPLNADKVER